MARKNYFKGISTSDLINIDSADFTEWNTQQLRQAVSRLASTANKRVQRLIKSEVPSYALEEYVRIMGRIDDRKYSKFGTKGLNENELRREFLRAKQFLKEESSTVTGAKELENEAIRNLNKNGIKMDTEDYRKLISNYLDLLDANPDVATRALKYKFAKNVDLDVPKDMNINDLAERLYIELDKTYRRGGPQYEGVAEYFTIE